MLNLWNNIQPAQVGFKINPIGAYAPTSALNKSPNWQKQPGYFPPVPAKAVPAPTHGLKQLIGHLPSIFTFNINSNGNS